MEMVAGRAVAAKAAGQFPAGKFQRVPLVFPEPAALFRRGQGNQADQPARGHRCPGGRNFFVVKRAELLLSQFSEPRFRR